MKAVPNLALGLKTSIRSLVPPISPLAVALVIFGILHAGMVEKAWGELLFAPRADYDAAFGPRFVASGDLDRDGDLDLAVASFSGVVSIYLNNGDGTFQARRDYTTGAQSSAVAIADLNRDGTLDLAVANGGSNTVSIIPGNGDGSFGTKVDLGTGGSPTCVATGDFNGDGYPDLAVTNSTDNTVSVLLSNSAGGFDVKTDFATGSNPQSVAISDVNGDGRPDLVIKNLTNSVSVLLGNGNGTFQSKADYPSGPGPGSVAVADLNGDGILDLAVSGYQQNVSTNNTGTVSVLMGVGDGTFRPGQVLSVDAGPYSIAAGDLDGDGVPDLVVPCTFASAVRVFLGIGDGTFQAQRSYSTLDGPVSAAIADLNGDGRLDLAVATYPDHFLTVLLNIPDHPPTLNTISNMTVNEGVTADQALSATNADGQALAFSLASGPTFASVTTTSLTTGNLHLAPGFTDGNGNPSTYVASVSVSDGSLTDSKPLTITVTNVNRPPVLNTLSNMALGGCVASTADQAISASDPDGDAITFTSSGPSFMTLTSNPQVGNTRTGNIHLAPPLGTSGTFAASVTATANGESDTKFFAIAMSASDCPPTLNQPANMTVNEGATADQTITATDPDGNPLALSKVSGPLFMFVTTTTPGAGTATGNIHLAPGFSDFGTYSAIVRVSDGSLTDAKSFTITVNQGLNRCPVANPGGPYSGLAGVPVSFNGTASSDPDGNPLTYAWDFDASDGIGVDAVGAMASHAYPAAGTFTVTLTVTDNASPFCSNTATTTASIAAACDATVFNGYDRIRLGSGRPFWFAFVQPATSCYANTDVVTSSFVLKYAGRQIPADVTKTTIGGDKNGDGIQEIKVTFTKDNLRTLFTGTGLANGSNLVTVTLEANLLTGGKLQGMTQVDVFNNGSFTAATVSPNPLNPEATLTFTTARRGSAKVEMFDIGGRLVRTILDERSLAPGEHEVRIEGRGERGETLASGIYFIRGVSPEGEFTKTIAILK